MKLILSDKYLDISLNNDDIKIIDLSSYWNGKNYQYIKKACKNRQDVKINL